MKPEFSLIPEPAPASEKRKKLSRAEFAQLMLDQNGLCGCGCGEKMDALREGITDEHDIPLAAGGTNAFANRKLLRNPCAGKKTKIDMGVIAKAKRQAGEKGQQARRAAGKTQPIRSPGFPSKERRQELKARMDARRAVNIARLDEQDSRNGDIK